MNRSILILAGAALAGSLSLVGCGATGEASNAGIFASPLVSNLNPVPPAVTVTELSADGKLNNSASLVQNAANENSVSSGNLSGPTTWTNSKSTNGQPTSDLAATLTSEWKATLDKVAGRAILSKLADGSTQIFYYLTDPTKADTDANSANRVIVFSRLSLPGATDSGGGNGDPGRL